MSVNWPSIRAQFPALRDWTYLNSATFGQVPLCAREAIAEHLDRRDRVACSDFLSWFSDMDRLRESIARLVHCQASDIAFIPNASTALSLLLGGLDWRTGDRVVTLEREFPNHYYFPRLLGLRDVEFVETSWESFYDAITPRTRVVAISTVNYTNGFRAPVEEISRFLKQRGVLFYLDGTQGTGALQFDMAAVEPDLFAVDAYKWLLSPNGAGFMYVSPGLRERLQPNVIGWRSHRGWRDPENLYEGSPEFAASAEKYEGGMLSFAPLYAMERSIEMILSIGCEAVERRVMELVEKTRAALRNAGAALLCDSSPYYESPVIAATWPGIDPSLLVRELGMRKVLVSARRGFLRVSPHLYNDESDIECFGSALGEILSRTP